MGDSDDYGNVSRNLRECFGMALGMVMATAAVLLALLI